ncbi:MAG: tetratricopeptide repeat protein [Deltaproteobacteria bacterium]|nr:tetratricopeptide repeat protein [Deltaproteobacteria bacterium]MBK8715383.1 tetratricopeptide repeat protein [Deltaproteobacteria bacterium]MBP7287730.1 tetratricopeptide repeat protein [Nannocystaceae bacterium]
MDSKTDGDDDALDDDDELDDPLLRLVAAAPSVPLGEAALPPSTVVAQNYVLLRVLGAGAMGVVYEATDRVLSRRVALKVHEIGRSDRAARLWREARAMARLSHPNVVTVHEVGVDGSRGFIAMELVEGTNARQWARAQRRRWRDIVAVYREAGLGLAAAHDVGLVHRDFKPDNLMIGDDGRVRVADFGLALEHERGEPSLPHERDDDRSTRTGARVGTPAYMAPEQRRGEPADARTDQFAFCVALHEALHGVRPRAGVRTADTHEGASDEVPRWIDVELARGLSEDPAARHADMRALLRALDPAPRRRRRLALWLAIAGVVVALGLLRLGGMLSSPSAVVPDCAASGGGIDDSWSPQRAVALAERWRRDLPALSEVAQRTVLPTLDAWREGWRDAARAACEATRVRGEQSEQRLDERMDCLGSARHRFDAVIALLEESQADAIARADNVLATLPDLAACGRVDLSTERERLDPVRREAYDRLTGELDHAVAQVAAGRFATGKAELDALVHELEREGFEGPVIEARRRRGETLLDLGRQSDAVAELVVAHDLALAHGSRDAVADVMLQLARAIGRTSAGTVEARRWLGSAERLAGELQWSAVRRERLAVAAVEIEFFGNDYEQTIELASRQLEHDALDAGDHIRTMSLHGFALERLGRFDEALAVHDRALAYAERERGAEHPSTAMVLGNRIGTLNELSRTDEVARSLARMLAIRIAAFGPDAPVVGEVHRQIGDAAREAGRNDDAIASYDRAEALHRRAGDDIGLIADLNNGGVARLLGGDIEGARVRYDEALAAAERVYGASSIRVAHILLNRTDLHGMANDPARAIAELERAQSILVREVPADDLGLAVTRTGLATLYARRGQHEAAEPLFREAMRAFEAKLPPRSPKRIGVLDGYAKVLASGGRHDEALEPARAAARLADEVLSSDHPQRLEAHIELLRELVAAGRGAEARPEADHVEALAAQVTTPPPSAGDLPELVRAARGRSGR